MKKQHSSSKKKEIHFPYAIRSFLGYLEGTQKSAHTIKNYQLDLLSFQKYLEQTEGTELTFSLSLLENLVQNDLTRYHDFLMQKGLKSNTRRRKLLTIQKFLHYLVKRNKLTDELPRKILTPIKVERVPYTVDFGQLLAHIQSLPQATRLDQRNRLLLWTLAETGCLVNEISLLKFFHFSETGRYFQLEIPGKAKRTLSISKELYLAVIEFQIQEKKDSHTSIFLGFNKFGSLGGPISPRGVELLVKQFSHQFGLGEFTPRTFRHSRVLAWFKENLPREEIQKRLGLKTAYAFRTFEPLLNHLHLL